MVNIGEFFLMDGTYSLQGRVKENGHFWIAGSEICVQVERTIAISSYCRGFARGSDNQIYLVSTRRDGESRQIDPLKLSFSPL